MQLLVLSIMTVGRDVPSFHLLSTMVTNKDTHRTWSYDVIMRGWLMKK